MRIGAAQPDERPHEVPEQQGRFAGLGVQPDNWVLSLELQPPEFVPVPLFLHVHPADHRAAVGVVVAIGVQRPQAVDQRLKRRSQTPVAATVFAHTVVPPYGGRVIARKMLIAGTRSTNVTSVCQLLALPCSESIRQDGLPVPAHGRMRPGHLAEPPGERQLLGVTRVLLVAQEHDPVREQGRPQLGDGVGWELAADLDPAHDRAERSADLGYLDMPVFVGRVSIPASAVAW